MSQVQFKKTLTGKEVVVYACTNCKSTLNSPIDEIGLRDHCPNCQGDFIVPGTDEFEARRRAEKEAIKEERIAQHGIRMERILKTTEYFFCQYIFESYPHVTEEDVLNIMYNMRNNIIAMVDSESD